MDISVEDDTDWWCLKAGRNGVLEDDWLDQNIVTIGWGDDGEDLRKATKEEFRKADPSHNKQLSKFVGHDSSGMEEGDVVIAYAPDKGHISGIGIIGDIGYNEDQSFRYLTEEEAREAMVQDHYYWRPVSWYDWGTPVSVSDLPKRFQVNGADQIPTPMTLNRYGTLSADEDRVRTLAQEVHDAETVEVSGGGFGPDRESQIRDWIADNIRTLGLHNARIEVRTDAGRVDVIADSDHGRSLIEVKYGRAGDRALGQLLGYMGATMVKNPEQVEGILVANSFTSRVKHAVSALDNVSLYQFSVTTTLTPVD